jgi:hypothetical protein
MPTSPNLVTLPGEVRDEVYGHYFRVEGGYVFDSNSEKLTALDGGPIHLSLIQTCRSIANDTRHLPFRLNDISFSTLCSPKWSAWAGRYQYQSNFLAILKGDMLYQLQGRHMSPDLEAALEQKFPRLMPDFKNRLEREYRPSIQYSRRNSNALRYSKDFVDDRVAVDSRFSQIRKWGEDVTMSREAIAFSLRFVAKSQRPKLAKLIEEILPGWTLDHDPQELLDLTLDPWDIPSKKTLWRIGQILRDDYAWEHIHKWHHGFREKYRFSAAAVAIRFLRELSAEQRQHLRHVTLVEDAYAVCSSSCHAMGLVDICKENPKLQIRRHVKLYRSPAASFGRALITLTYSDLSRLPSRNTRSDFVTPLVMASEIAQWLKEAAFLPHAGMPPNSFTLFLDGEPHKAFYTRVFESVLLLGEGLTQAYGKLLQMRPHQFQERVYWDLYSDHLSMALKLLTDQDSTPRRTSDTALICTNFDVGRRPDVEKLVVDRLHWDSMHWDMAFIMVGLNVEVRPSAFGQWHDNVLRYFEQKPPGMEDL